MKRVVYTQPDGSTAIMVPSEKALAAAGGDITKLNGYPAGNLTAVECDHTELPTDRTFRNAWEVDPDAAHNTYLGKRVKLNSAKGIEIAKELVRQHRAPVLSKLDIDYSRADEGGNPAEKAAVVAKRNQARDATADARIVNALDEMELKVAVEGVKADLDALAE